MAIVSRKFAEKIWPGADAIGKVLRESSTKDWLTVVGLVEDVQHYSSTPGPFSSDAQGDVYISAEQGIIVPRYDLSIVARSKGDVYGLSQQIAAVVGRINPNVPLSNWRTMSEVVSKSTDKPRSTTWMFTSFASLALVLGLVGIYSVISYTVTHRTREIGVRIALGADRADIIRMIVLKGATLTLTGIAAGIACAVALNRLITGLLYDVSASDPLIYLTVGLFVAIAATLATCIPSLRATRVSPTVALRCE